MPRCIRFAISAFALSVSLGAAPLWAETAADVQAPDVLAAVEAYHPPPEGFPPAMGDVIMTDKGKTFVFTTFDFSIGAFDASAFFLGMESETPSFRLSAWPGGNHEAEMGVLRLTGSFAGKVTPGAQAKDAVVEISIEKDRDGRRWTSEGGPALLVIDEFTPDQPGFSSGYGRARGHFEARICSGDGEPAVVPKNARCRDVAGQFETAVQFEP